MKKFTLLLLSTFIIGLAFGQSLYKEALEFDQKKMFKPVQIPSDFLEKYRSFNTASKAPGDEYWLSYALSLNFNLKGDSGLAGRLAGMTVFPDTSVYLEFSDGWGRPWIHMLGNVLDMRSFEFQITPGVDLTNKSYSVDSMSIPYVYARTSDPSIVDTIVIYTYTQPYDTSNNIRENRPLLLGTNYGVDTVKADIMYYNAGEHRPMKPQSGFPRPQGMLTTKVLLTANDTSSGVIERLVALNGGPINVPAGKRVYTAVTFAPGINYSEGDTLQNRLTLLSIKEQDGDNFHTYNQGDLNLSSIIPTDVRYHVDTGAGGWNFLFVPSYAYTATWPYEHHLLIYKVTEGNPISVEDPEFETGVTLFQNEPNPFNNSTVIKFAVEKSTTVNFEVFDLTGRQVLNVDNRKVTPGTHALEIHKKQLPSGTYFYKLTTADGFVATKKMVIR